MIVQYKRGFKYRRRHKKRVYEVKFNTYKTNKMSVELPPREIFSQVNFTLLNKYK